MGPQPQGKRRPGQQLVELGHAVLRVEQEGLPVDLVQGVVRGVPVGDEARGLHVGMALWRARARLSRTPGCPGPGRRNRCRDSGERGALPPCGSRPGEGLRERAAPLGDARPGARVDLVHLRSAAARAVEVRVGDAVLVEVGPEAVGEPGRARVAAEGVARPPGKPRAPLAARPRASAARGPSPGPRPPCPRCRSCPRTRRRDGWPRGRSRPSGRAPRPPPGGWWSSPGRPRPGGGASGIPWRRPPAGAPRRSCPPRPPGWPGAARRSPEVGVPQIVVVIISCRMSVSFTWTRPAAPACWARHALSGETSPCAITMRPRASGPSGVWSSSVVRGRNSASAVTPPGGRLRGERVGDGAEGEGLGAHGGERRRARPAQVRRASRAACTSRRRRGAAPRAGQRPFARRPGRRCGRSSTRRGCGSARPGRSRWRWGVVPPPLPRGRRGGPGRGRRISACPPVYHTWGGSRSREPLGRTLVPSGLSRLR